MKSNPICPRCSQPNSHRSHRKSAWERLLGLAFIHPFRCQACTHRFFRLKPWTHYVLVVDDLREYARVAVNLQAAYAGPSDRGLGTITDLSVDGCGMSIKEVPLSDSSFELRIELPDGQPPLQVKAIVRNRPWPGRVGFNFEGMSPTDRVRLGRVVRPQRQ